MLNVLEEIIRISNVRRNALKYSSAAISAKNGVVKIAIGSPARFRF